MSSQPFFHLIFDSDGTLSDSHTFSFEGVVEVFRQSRLPMPSYEEYREHCHPPYMNFYVERGVTATKEQVYEWYYAKARYTEAELFPDVVRALKILSRRELNCRLSVVSAQRNAILLQQLAKVRHHFDPIVGERAQKADELMRLRDLYPLPRERVLYIGDSKTDMEDAQRAGITAVGITRGSGVHHVLRSSGAEHVIEHLDELLAMVGAA